jgi:hypothetical protein
MPNAECRNSGEARITKESCSGNHSGFDIWISFEL